MKRLALKWLPLLLLLLKTSLSQSQVVVSTTVACATSVDGTVVGVPNPLNPPIVTVGFTGTLPAGNYYVQIAWVDAAGHVTLVGPEVQRQLTGTGRLNVQIPTTGKPSTAALMNVYIGTTSGGETLQGSSTGGFAPYVQSTPLVTGAAVPATNTTICAIVANDAGWPTGTGYKVGMTTPAGDTVPGFPMQWQLLGPGTTINVANGLPLYNGNVTYPIPILARPYNHAPQSISGPLDLGGYPLLNVGAINSSAPINSGPITSSAVNNTFNAALYPGSDIGAQVNAAAATCAANSPCHILIPAGQQYSFATPIVFVNDETVECSQAASIDNAGTSTADYQLSYTGTATAVVMNVHGGKFLGCSLLLGSSAAGGVVMGGVSNWAQGVSLSTGGVNTKLVRISSIPGSTSGSEDNHFVDSRISNFIGRAIYLDHCNDCFVSNVTAYGIVGNTTGVTLTIDSQAGGSTIHNLSGGNSGLHGLVVQNTFGGNPTWIFMDSFISDVSSSDGWLFDATLGSANIGATIINSWAAGSTGAGVRFSGGRMIVIGGGNKIRSNGQDGVLIDSNSAGSILIESNEILGNNTSNISGDSGIRVAAHPDGLTIIGNRIGNDPEVGGHQAYGFTTSSDIDNFNFSENNCSFNVTGCMNVMPASLNKVTAIGNTSQTESYLPNILPSELEVDQIGNTGAAVVMPVTPGGEAGFTGNLFFDGTNYNTRTDAANNGAWGLLGDFATGGSCIYAIPTNTPASGQTLSASTLATKCAMRFSPTQVTVPTLTGSGKALACLDASGNLYRGTATTCP